MQHVTIESSAAVYRVVDTESVDQTAQALRDVCASAACEKKYESFLTWYSVILKEVGVIWGIAEVEHGS